MRRLGTRTLASMLASAWLIGCGTTEPLHSDVDLARRAWLSGRATNYSFEIATTSSWFPQSGYVRVQVTDGRVVAAIAPDGTPKPLSSQPTIDELWDRILAARDRGELNSADFDLHGVPIETDTGPWPVDGGMHYSVRGYTRVR
jgi:hypothetical protein